MYSIESIIIGAHWIEARLGWVGSGWVRWLGGVGLGFIANAITKENEDFRILSFYSFLLRTYIPTYDRWRCFLN